MAYNHYPLGGYMPVELTKNDGTQKNAAEITATIMKEMEQSIMIELPGTTKPRLETVVRYLNRDKISARGDTWFKKNYDRLVTDCMIDLVKAREKAITDYLNKKEKDDKAESFRQLIARGTGVPEAYKAIYG
jgi:predicted nucleotide-binding protein (sugar kinase/HSP70/actin superfamily)